MNGNRFKWYIKDDENYDNDKDNNHKDDENDDENDENNQNSYNSNNIRKFLAEKIIVDKPVADYH